MGLLLCLRKSIMKMRYLVNKFKYKSMQQNIYFRQKEVTSHGIKLSDFFLQKYCGRL